MEILLFASLCILVGVVAVVTALALFLAIPIIGMIHAGNRKHPR